MDKLKLYEKQLTGEQGTQYTLEYWLTSRRVLDERDNEEMLYGAEIIKHNNHCCIEQECVCGLSYCQGEMESWIYTLALGNVTPIALVALADNFLSSWSIAV